uniref:GrpB family protein n=1 Tax=Rossellomorea sp. y25 TaxID=3118174 RepID=UPI004053FB35
MDNITFFFVENQIITLEGEPRWEQQRSFQERLNEKPFLKGEYAELKKHLADRTDDREAHSEAKAAFIQRVLNMER